MSTTQDIVAKLWGLCHVLRDDGSGGGESAGDVRRRRLRAGSAGARHRRGRGHPGDLGEGSLVGAAIHPLNQPGIDPATNRVTYGYGILQPRVSISLGSASRSKFVEIFSGYTGIDPYTTAVSDVYQDLFGEGSFIGKGIYDVDAFQQALAGALPRA